MTPRYAGANVEVFEIWAWYKAQIDKATDARIPEGYWHYRTFDNGVPVPDAARRIYRERKDLRDAFPDPWVTGPEGGFQAWLRSESNVMAGV